MTKDFKEAFENTRSAGIIAAGALNEINKIIKPGISTEEIDKICYDYINDHKAYSAPLFYRGFPKSCCTSTNHVVCHGIPSDKILKDGDIVNVDVTAFKNGWHGDTSRMVKVGEISVKAEKLINTTFEAMMKAIDIVKDGINGFLCSTEKEWESKINYFINNPDIIKQMGANAKKHILKHYDLEVWKKKFIEELKI